MTNLSLRISRSQAAIPERRLTLVPAGPSLPEATASAMGRLGATPYLQRSRNLELLEVRSRAAQILAAIGSAKLCRIAIFRAAKWANISTEHGDDLYTAYLAAIRSAEWFQVDISFQSVTEVHS